MEGILRYVNNIRNWFITSEKQQIVYMCRPQQGTKVYNKNDNTYEQTTKIKQFIVSDQTGIQRVVTGKEVATKYKFMSGEEVTQKKLTSILQEDGTIGWQQMVINSDLIGRKLWAIHIPSEIINQPIIMAGQPDRIQYINRSGVQHGNGDFLVTTDIEGFPDFDNLRVINGEDFQKIYKMPGQPEEKAVTIDKPAEIVNKNQETENKKIEISKAQGERTQSESSIAQKENKNTQNSKSAQSENKKQQATAMSSVQVQRANTDEEFDAFDDYEYSDDGYVTDIEYSDYSENKVDETQQNIRQGINIPTAAVIGLKPQVNQNQIPDDNINKLDISIIELEAKYEKGMNVIRPKTLEIIMSVDFDRREVINNLQKFFESSGCDVDYVGSRIQIQLENKTILGQLGVDQRFKNKIKFSLQDSVKLTAGRLRGVNTATLVETYRQSLIKKESGQLQNLLTQYELQTSAT